MFRVFSPVLAVFSMVFTEHASATFQRPGPTRNFDNAKRKRLRTVVITSILETDMAKHGKHIQWLGPSQPPQPTRREHRLPDLSS